MNGVSMLSRKTVVRFMCGMAVMVSCFILSCMTVYAAPPGISLNDENNTMTIYDADSGRYLDADDYHANFDYEYLSEYDKYGCVKEDDVHLCDCDVCKHISSGYEIIVPDEDPIESETEEGSVFIEGTDVTDGETPVEPESSKGTCIYDPDSNTLTLKNYQYNGTGLFTEPDTDVNDTDVDEEDGDTDSDDADVDEEDGDTDSDDADVDEEDGDTDSDDEYGDDDVDDEDEYVDEEDEDADSDDTDVDEEDGDTDSGDSDVNDEDEDTNDSETGETKGVIRSEGCLTLKLIGKNEITITDDDADTSYGINVPGGVDVDSESKGVLYVMSASKTDIYGKVAEPEVILDTEATTTATETRSGTMTETETRPTEPTTTETQPTEPTTTTPPDNRNTGKTIDPKPKNPGPIVSDVISSGPPKAQSPANISAVNAPKKAKHVSLKKIRKAGKAKYPSTFQSSTPGKDGLEMLASVTAVLLCAIAAAVALLMRRWNGDQYAEWDEGNEWNEWNNWNDWNDWNQY